MSNKFIAPNFQGKSFTCPHCGVLAKQDRTQLYGKENGATYMAVCQHCNQLSLWYTNDVSYYNRSSTYIASNTCDMYYPKLTNIPLPNDDLDDDIKNDYTEASNIVQDSPRGACALLRLALQKLMVQVGQDGKDINKNIGNLVKGGLNVTIQQALDTVRVIGNEAVHPGVLDLKDDADTAGKMFGLINIIANFLITQPKEIAEIYGTLPDDKLDGITIRDS